MKSASTCTAGGCTRKVKARGLCQAHYRRHLRGAELITPIGTANGEPIAWIRRMVANSRSHECVVWPFAKDGDGYGMISRSGVMRRASQVVLETVGQPRPTPDHIAAHAPSVCHNPSCVNPDHLRWATHAENASDELIDGTRAYGENHGNAKLTRDDIVSIRADSRPPRFIAAEFGCTTATVWSIKANKSRVRCR